VLERTVTTVVISFSVGHGQHVSVLMFYRLIIYLLRNNFMAVADGNTRTVEPAARLLTRKTNGCPCVQSITDVTRSANDNCVYLMEDYATHAIGYSAVESRLLLLVVRRSRPTLTLLVDLLALWPSGLRCFEPQRGQWTLGS